MEKNKSLNEKDLLIIGYLRNDLSSEQKQELVAWIKEDNKHKQRFDELSEIWITAQSLIDPDKESYKKAFLHFKKRIGQKKRKELFSPIQYYSLLKYAAIVLVGFLLGGWLFFSLGEKRITNEMTATHQLIVPFGAKAEFQLSDGSNVILNAGSKLKYAASFGITDRNLILEGEGYFKVAKREGMPFVVQTSHVNIQAIGTEFNVKAYPEEKTIETTLVEGSVQIGQNDAKGKKVIAILEPNQKITYFIDNQLISMDPAERKPIENTPGTHQPQRINAKIVKNLDIKPMVSWKDNRWIIERQNLQNLATDLERKFDVHIYFESERLKKFRFTGTLMDEPIEQVLKVIGTSAPIEYNIKGKDVYLYESPDFEKIYKTLIQ
jgi:ferric-dicitrate binding protein FerR (iron transport regulator)